MPAAPRQLFVPHWFPPRHWCRCEMAPLPARRALMVALLYRPFVIGLPIALIACMNPASTVAEQDASVPLGIDLGGSGPVPAKPAPPAQSRGCRRSPAQRRNANGA